MISLCLLAVLMQTGDQQVYEEQKVKLHGYLVGVPDKYEMTGLAKSNFPGASHVIPLNDAAGLIMIIVDTHNEPGRAREMITDVGKILKDKEGWRASIMTYNGQAFANAIAGDPNKGDLAINIPNLGQITWTARPEALTEANLKFMRMGRSDKYGASSSDVVSQIGKTEDQNAVTRAQNFIAGLAAFDMVLGQLEKRLPGEQQVHMVVMADHIVPNEMIQGQQSNSQTANGIETGEIWNTGADNYFASSQNYEFDSHYALVHAWDLQGRANAFLTQISPYRVTKSDILDTMQKRIDQIARVYYPEPQKNIRFKHGRKRMKVVAAGS